MDVVFFFRSIAYSLNVQNFITSKTPFISCLSSDQASYLLFRRTTQRIEKCTNKSKNILRRNWNCIVKKVSITKHPAKQGPLTVHFGWWFCVRCFRNNIVINFKLFSGKANQNFIFRIKFRQKIFDFKRNLILVFDNSDFFFKLKHQRTHEPKPYKRVKMHYQNAPHKPSQVHLPYKRASSQKKQVYMLRLSLI